MTTLDPTGIHEKNFHRLLQKLAANRPTALASLIALIFLAVSLRNPAFLAPANLASIAANCVQPAIVSCGVMLVIVTGEIDISVGSMLGFLTASLGILMSKQFFPQWAALLSNNPAAPFSVPAAITLTLLLGTLLGLLNGILVALLKIPSIIVTLGMLTILKGLTISLLKPGNITDLPDAFHFLGTGDLSAFMHLPFPVGRLSLYLTALVLFSTYILIHHTPLGRRIYAVGSNPHAAALAGISLPRIKIFTFAFTGFLVALASLLTPVAVFDSGTGDNFELLVVTCVVVGGVSITGGQGTLAGVTLAVLLLMMQKTVLIFLNLSPNSANWDRAIQGTLILLAVLIDHFAKDRAPASNAAVPA